MLEEKLPIITEWKNKLLANPMWIKNIGVLTMFFGAGIGLYTGVLLSSLRSTTIMEFFNTLVIVFGIWTYLVLQHLFM